jgi:dihydroorotate dehydrogenase (NAD+) catalytic subunit
VISKKQLDLGKPLMNAAGTLGFIPDRRASLPWDELGAFITNPISLHPRRATRDPAMIRYPGGFLMHTGLPNPGFEAILKQYERRWQEATLQIIPHLMADRPEETQSMVRALEAVENVGAVELGFAPLLADDIILLAIDMSRGELPLIASLPSEQVLRVGARAVEHGAAAISIAAPRGVLTKDGRRISGRLFGPSLFPLAMDVVQSAAKAGLPIIGAGGVAFLEQAQAMIEAGAIGAQIDFALWLPARMKKAPSQK